MLSLFPAIISLVACEPASESTANPDPAHNSRISLDWAGSYQGTLPCADCEGITTVITLHNNSRYEISRKYLGKQDTIFYTTGNFDWNKEGSVVRLSGETPSSFQVGENRIIQLNTKGEKIDGNLAEKYILTKIVPEITETYWKVVNIGGAPVPAGNNREPHIILHSSNNRMSGSGGCNNLMGSFTMAEPQRIRFGQLAATRMACPNMETEGLLSEVLETADSYDLVSDTLVLRKATTPLAKFVAVYLR